MCCFSITHSAADLSHTLARWAVNLEPLRTVKNYLLAYGYDNISLRLVVLNLAGNLIAFAPMGVFLPALFRWQRSIFFFIAHAEHHGVEVLQVYCGTGFKAMDDLISQCAARVYYLPIIPFAALIQDRRMMKMTTDCKRSRFFIDKPCLPL